MSYPLDADAFSSPGSLACCNVTTMAKKNPLMDAAIGGETKTLRALLKDKPKIPGNILQRTIFSGWAQLDDMTILKMLLDAGAKPNSKTGGETPLYSAAMVGPFPSRSLAATKLLLEHGAKPNLVSRGETPLHVAVETIATETSACLIDGGADVNALSDEGKAPVHTCVDAFYNFAVHDGEIQEDELDNAEHYVMSHLKHLIDGGADLSMKNAEGQTALASIFLKPHYPQTIRTLLMDGGSPLDSRVRIGEDAHIDMLVGAIAADHSVEEVMRLLEHHDPMTPQTDMKGATALAFACSSRPDVALALFEARPELVAQTTTKTQSTMLHCATPSNDTALLEFILEKGVDIDAKNVDGKTALDMAIENEFEGSAGFLRERSSQ